MTKKKAQEIFCDDSVLWEIIIMFYLVEVMLSDMFFSSLPVFLFKKNIDVKNIALFE